MLHIRKFNVGSENWEGKKNIIIKNHAIVFQNKGVSTNKYCAYLFKKSKNRYTVELP